MERIKVWSILMLIMIIPLRSSAQVYTELDLIGKWTLTETTGDPNFLTGFDFIIPKPKLYSESLVSHFNGTLMNCCFKFKNIGLFENTHNKNVDKLLRLRHSRHRQTPMFPKRLQIVGKYTNNS